MAQNKGGKSEMKKGQSEIVAVIVLALIVIASVVFLVTSLRKPEGGTSTQTASTNPVLAYTGNPVGYLEQSRAATPEPTAEQVRDQILYESQIPLTGAGVVTTQPDFEILWIGGPKQFQVELRSTDFGAAKAAAEQWLISKGFGSDDFCNGTRLFFYVAASVKNSLPAGTQFDPTPSCY